MENLRRSLEGLGFSTLEVNIYLILLDNGAMSPYQIAKNVDISRSSIYNALEHMLNKGMVEVIPEDTVMYVMIVVLALAIIFYVKYLKINKELK